MKSHPLGRFSLSLKNILPLLMTGVLFMSLNLVQAVGGTIAFSSRPNFISDIFVMIAEGKRLKRLTKDEGRNRRPVYSPDGTKIAFASNRDGDYNIYLMEANGRNAVQLTRTPRVIDNVSPSWPQGSLAVNPSGKLPTSWGVVKRTGNPR